MVATLRKAEPVAGLARYRAIDSLGRKARRNASAHEQPDFNWANPEVRTEFEDVLRFWFARGADGIRIDSAALLTKDPELPETGPGDPSPYSDRDDVHDIYRAWRGRGRVPRPGADRRG